jgi:hypothetical protein
MKRYSVMGTAVLPVELKINAESEEQAMAKVEDLINSYNIIMNELSLLTTMGNVHSLKAHDFDITWESSEEE